MLFDDDTLQLLGFGDVHIELVRSLQDQQNFFAKKRWQGYTPSPHTKAEQQQKRTETRRKNRKARRMKTGMDAAEYHAQVTRLTEAIEKERAHRRENAEFSAKWKKDADIAEDALADAVKQIEALQVQLEEIAVEQRQACSRFMELEGSAGSARLVLLTPLVTYE